MYHPTFLADTYEQAKKYVEKKKRVRAFPVSYCELSPKKKRLNHQNDIATAMEEVRVKVERLTYLKRSIDVLNRQLDKREIMDINDEELEEFRDLLTEAGTGNVGMPTTIDECEAVSSERANIDSEDCILIEPHIRSASGSSNISTGIDPLDIDRDFSVEYTYTTDVSSPSARS